MVNPQTITHSGCGCVETRERQRGKISFFCDKCCRVLSLQPKKKINPWFGEPDTISNIIREVVIHTKIWTSKEVSKFKVSQKQISEAISGFVPQHLANELGLCCTGIDKDPDLFCKVTGKTAEVKVTMGVRNIRETVWTGNCSKDDKQNIIHRPGPHLFIDREHNVWYYVESIDCNEWSKPASRRAGSPISACTIHNIITNRGGSFGNY